MQTDHYADFVAEAYIKPIRSVVIIDDDYPTYDDVLSAGFKDDAVRESKAWRRNPERIRKVIRRFRERNPPLVVDIHDGTNVDPAREVALAPHLHQSDLLVLDYQLDRTKQNDGTLAIEILRRLTSNNHFNLVVVYTSHALDHVFYEVLTGLVGVFGEISHSEGGIDAAQELVDDADVGSEDFPRRILASMNREAYFDYRHSPDKAAGRMLNGEPPYAAFKAICDEAAWNPRVRKKVFRYVLADVQDKLSDQMQSDDGRVELNWSSEPPYWIQSDTIFVAFSDKAHGDDLIGELKHALNAWNPEPSRLLLGKLRADVHEHGVTAQTPVLASKRALTLWYLRLLRADEDLHRQYVAEVVSRHSDQVMSNILPNVEAFAERLIHSERASKEDHLRLCCKRFGVDLRKSAEEDKALLEHNAFVCAKTPHGRHLTTGHIFELFDRCWICLSPACDLVPSQVGKVQSDALGRWLPFMAVRLHSVVRGKWQKDRDGITSGRYVFVPRDGGDIDCFSFSEHSNSNPEWRLFLAENGGIFVTDDDADGCLQFSAASTVAGDAGQLENQQGVARIVGQLRYEYALNLLHRLGGSLTRIGLDFLSGVHP